MILCWFFINSDALDDRVFDNGDTLEQGIAHGTSFFNKLYKLINFFLRGFGLDINSGPDLPKSRVDALRSFYKPCWIEIPFEFHPEILQVNLLRPCKEPGGNALTGPERAEQHLHGVHPCISTPHTGWFIRNDDELSRFIFHRETAF